MTTQQLITNFAQDVWHIAVSFAVLLGFGVGLRFWWRVLRV